MKINPHIKELIFLAVFAVFVVVVIFIFIGVVFVSAQVKEPVALCPVVAEIIAEKLGRITALTKGTVGCIKPEDYLVAGWKQGIAPPWDKTEGEMTEEEYVAALNVIARDFGLTSEETLSLEQIYVGVREKLAERGEIVSPTRTEGEFVVQF